MAAAEHGGGDGNRRADPAVVDELATGLDAAAEEGIRRAAQQQAVLAGVFHLLDAVLTGAGQRLFAIGVLAGLQGHHIDELMLIGRGQVQHQLDLGIVHDLLVRENGLGDVVFFLSGQRALGDQVAHGDDLNGVRKNGGQVLQIDAGNISASDDSDLGTHNLAPSEGRGTLGGPAP